MDGNYPTIPGFTVNDFQQEGYNAGILNIAGFTASECKKVGYNAKQLKLGDVDITNQVVSASPNDLVFTLEANDLNSGALKTAADALLGSMSNNTGVY